MCDCNEGKRLESLFDGIDEVIYVSDPDTYEILYANKYVRDLLGEGLLGNKCYEVFHDRSEPCSFCTNDKIFGKNLGKTYTWEFYNEKLDKWYKCIDKAIEWPPLSEYVRYELAIDITESKLLIRDMQEQTHKFRRMIDLLDLANNTSHDAAIVTDEDYNVLHLNQSACDILGCRPEHCLDKGVFDVLGIPEHCEVIAATLGATTYYEGMLSIGKDKHIWVEIAKLVNHKVHGFIFRLHDNELAKKILAIREWVKE